MRRVWGATWRIVAFLLLFGLCLTPSVLLLQGFGPDDGEGFGPWLQVLLEGGALIAILLASAVMAKGVDRRRFVELGLSLEGLVPRFGLGLLLGAAMIALASSVLWLAGLAELHPARLAGRGDLPLAALAGILNVAMQDLLLAGYPFLVLAPRFGPRVATGVLAVFFVLLHAGALAGGDVAIPALNLLLAGVLLVSCRIVSQGLWLTIGVHFAWNFLQGPVLGLSVTGRSLTDRPPLLEVSGPAWISGGEFGLEGGLVATLATAAGIAALWLGGSRRSGGRERSL